MEKWDLQIQKAMLQDEKEAIDKIKEAYDEALDGVNEKIQLLQSQITQLQALGSDDEGIKSMIQSKVYQKQYQEAIKSQINAICDNITANNYTTINEYLNKSYEEGFIGTMYSLQSQGIPLVMPIDQEQVAKAIVHDTKLSNSLYNQLGINTNHLKKSIRSELSRGIAQGMSYNDIARNISNAAKVDKNKTIRIARTEAHRVNQQSTMDAMKKAKDKGADVVKQWDSTLDKKTRPSHQRVDGEIRKLVDEKGEESTFSNGLRFPGDPNGLASEVVNCRCVLLQRAKWALDDDELKTHQERAAYYRLDKNDNFKEYKTNYLNNMEENSIIIDEKTPCLLRMSDNKIVDTSVIQVSPTKKEYKDWEFDWTEPEKKGYNVYGIKANDDDRIQGLIALKPDYKDIKAMMVYIVESAPFNNQHNKHFTEKEYSGVGGHLFAEAVKQSYENGLDGYVTFIAKTNLIEYYQKELGAILVNPKTRLMMIDERNGKKLYDKYYKGK